jgi:hypothetical protein
MTDREDLRPTRSSRGCDVSRSAPTAPIFVATKPAIWSRLSLREGRFGVTEPPSADDPADEGE